MASILQEIVAELQALCKDMDKEMDDGNGEVNVLVGVDVRIRMM